MESLVNTTANTAITAKELMVCGSISTKAKQNFDSFGHLLDDGMDPSASRHGYPIGEYRSHSEGLGFSLNHTASTVFDVVLLNSIITVWATENSYSRIHQYTICIETITRTAAPIHATSSMLVSISLRLRPTYNHPILVPWQ